THETDVAYPFAETGVLIGGTDSQGSGESFPIIDTPGGLVVGSGILIDIGDGDDSVCPSTDDGLPSAGMLSGASYLTRTPGDVDRGCGKFNLPVEMDNEDLEHFFQHVLGGAVSARVVG
ncbi:MAG: hypothetical protein LC624_11360, partial [Halobacteriales archaeon]|nr:hypothetical protein [Halobacteriales archaeon]